MAIYEGYDTINRITGLDVPWTDKTGQEVEDFISRRMKNPLDKSIQYDQASSILTIYNPEHEPIASGPITVVPPAYTTSIEFSEIVVNKKVHNSHVEVNYTETSKFEAGINVKTYYQVANNFYDLQNKVSVIFSIEGTTDQLIVDNIVPNEREDNSLKYIDITPLFQRDLQGRRIKAEVTVNGIYSYAIYEGNVTVHKIEISTSSTHVADRKVVFNIDGLSSTNNMNLEYYDVPLLPNVDLNSIERKSIPLTTNSHAELELPVGGHQILARVCNSDGTFYSNWVQANVISWDKQNETDMMAIIGGIPTTINNCENSKLFQIISVPGLGGKVEIVSYLANDAGVFEDDQSTWPEFNRLSLSADSNDEPSVYDYYSYIELTDITNATKAVAFSLVVNDVSYNLYQLEVVNGYLYGSKVFTINIQENPYNVNNAFNYVPGAIEDFSQIKGQSTTLFTNTNESMEASDGWTIDENLIAYKISGQSRNLFNSPKNYDALLAGRGFTIEVMLKNYNINGEDTVMSIGNLLFGPGYTRVQSTNEEIFVNSRADYEKEVMTHLTFVYDPAYKPATYNNIYDQLFNENGLKYSDFQYTYPILKVYVNGTINRELEIKPSDLQNESGFKFQINPSTSDLNLYIFRTYNWAFNYQEVQKNYISSRQTALEKKEIYDRNNILGDDGRVSFYKTMQNNNVIVVVLPETDKPLYFGNRKTNGDGVDPNNPDEGAKATLLVHYKDPKYAAYNGRFTKGKYKAQGSSAKKYMIHNVQYSKGKFISESDLAAGNTETSSTYAMPTDTENIQAKKFVGKVNYASSMQSHKLGSVKLFDKAYKNKVFLSTYQDKLYSGGKKACLEEAFVYFYYNLKPGQDIDTITINDLYTTETINGIVVPKDQDVKFFGFQTWGSGKTDDPTYGYGDHTPEYLLVEGADNGSTGANFKQPWAAFQTWTSDVTYDTQKSDAKYIIQQSKQVTASTLDNGSPNPKYDPTAGLLIDGETIKFDANGTDPWDIDYGLTELDEDKDLWQFTDEVKAPGSSLHHFVEFYNNCYTYDFTNLMPNPNTDKSKFQVFNKYGLDDHRIFMDRSNVSIEDKNDKGEIVTIGTAAMFDTYRWDSRINKWVPAGLHHDGTKWETFNLKTVYSNIPTTSLYAEYSENEEVMQPSTWLNKTIQNTDAVNRFVVPAFRDMFRANVEKYCDKEDIIYHQAFIRLVSGTDNRAKNTYFQIIGKLYEDGVKTEVGDYKIRLMQDDMDTIFATDNNGQQVKPYYLLEPAFNKDTEKMWGDHHSSFFYPFDVCYYQEINNMLGQIINYLVGSATTIKDKQTLLYDYFFKTQLEFPEILYNHHAEIYYEMPQVLFKEGRVNAFGNTLSGFANNSVQYPLSLSHGRCIESEYQFMKDRLLLLGTQSNSAHNLYGTEWQLSTEDSGGNEGGTQLVGRAEYTDYFYPNLTFKRSNVDEYIKLVNLTSRNDVNVNYDTVFSYVLPAPGIPSTISQLVTPSKEYALLAPVDTTITSYISSAQKIKSLTITEGFDFMHYLPNLPNVKYLNINGSTAKYSVNSIDIAVKDSLPIVENLQITNTSFANSMLDFRNCNRLGTINLKGCVGIKNIILPESNRLSHVYLPNDLKELSLGVSPNLEVLDIPDGTKLTAISINSENINSNFDYINLLDNYIDYSNLSSFVLNNTPSDGLIITEDIANRLAEVQMNGSVQKSIKGKFVIKNRIENVSQSGDVTYTWGDLDAIGYATKKKLTQAFGKIDSVDNTVVFEFKEEELNYHKISPEIAIDVPNGGITVYPFDSLYFQEGNDIRITDAGTLDITYSIDGTLPTGSTLDPNTGRLTLSENNNQTYTVNITVTKTNGQKYDNIATQIYLGYKAPRVGDFAYSDGTFSTAKNDSKTIIGLVYQVEESIPNREWKLCILSTTSVSGCFGADFYGYNTTYSTWSESYTEQQSIFNFMTASSGLGLSMSKPTSATYLQVSTPNYEYDIDGIDREYVLPDKIVDSGKSYTVAFAGVGQERLITYINKNQTFKTAMQGSKYYSNNKLQNLNTTKDIDEVCKLFNEAALLEFYPGADYSKVLNPVYLKALAFEPSNLSGEFAVNSYSKGNWYIPSIKELELLIYYRILSTTKENDINIKSYWNSTEYSRGFSIFSATSDDFAAFLNSDMIAAQASASNKNYAYGRVLKNYSLPVYGWQSTYPYIEYSTYDYLETCKRDIQRNVALCCQVTVIKK